MLLEKKAITERKINMLGPKKIVLSMSIVLLVGLGGNYVYADSIDQERSISTNSTIVESSLEKNVTQSSTKDSEVTDSPNTLSDIENDNNVKYDSDKNPTKPATNKEAGSIKILYGKAIDEGKINPKTYSFDAFKENYLIGKNNYEELKDWFKDYSSYDEWFSQIMNYNAFPDGEGHSPSESNRQTRATKEQNANRFKKDIRKGDIIIVNSGGFGHAAIATSDNYILEMTGGASGPLFTNWVGWGISDNNHQFSKHNWLWGIKEQGFKKNSRMIDSYLQIWRIPNKAMANKCASYADKNFWNSSGKYVKNRHITYLLRSSTLTTNPNYCSKMVFQAYWNGSGNAPVMQGYASGLTFIAPNALPNLFTASYRPYKVGTY